MSNSVFEYNAKGHILPPGTQLHDGKYEILGLLGQPGGFGITYRAKWSGMEGDVAIKELFIADTHVCNRYPSNPRIITAGDADDFAQAKKSFIKEAKVLFNLRHPNIVKFFDQFEENNTAYIVMECVPGKTLAEIVSEKGGLYTSDAVKIIKKLAEVVGYLHDNGFIHRDISPENVILRDSDGEPVLIDFGLAKNFQSKMSQNLSTIGGYKPGFSALEAYGSTNKKTPQMDIYSLGALFYYLLKGEAPTEASALALGVPLKHIKKIKEPYRSVITKAMKTRADERYQSARVFMEALEGNELEKLNKGKHNRQTLNETIDSINKKTIDSINKIRNDISDLKKHYDKRSRKKKLAILFFFTFCFILTTLYNLGSPKTKVMLLSLITAICYCPALILTGKLYESLRPKDALEALVISFSGLPVLFIYAAAKFHLLPATLDLYLILDNEFKTFFIIWSVIFIFIILPLILTIKFVDIDLIDSSFLHWIKELEFETIVKITVGYLIIIMLGDIPFNR